MLILERIDEDLKKALKEKNQELLLVLRMLKSDVKNLEIEKKESLKDEDVIKLLKTQVKRHKESMEEYKKGNREDLASKEQSELEIIEKYLPAQMSEAEIEQKVKEIVENLSEEQKSNPGPVMGMVMKELGGQADGSFVKQILNKFLN